MYWSWLGAVNDYIEDRTYDQTRPMLPDIWAKAVRPQQLRKLLPSTYVDKGGF